MSEFWHTLSETGISEGLPVVDLPIGTEFFRADRDGAKSPNSSVPAFFTDKNTVVPYTKPFPGKLNLGETTISAYRVKKSARLLHITLNSVGKIFDHPKITEDDIEVLSQWLLVGKMLPYLYPSGFTETNLRNYQTGRTTFPMYLNRRVAEIICKLGFDGWIVKPFNPEKRTGIFQVSVIKVKQLQTLLGKKQPELLELPIDTLIHLFLEDLEQQITVPYPPEIMLCKWETIMERYR
jgi:hypothetical protein